MKKIDFNNQKESEPYERKEKKKWSIFSVYWFLILLLRSCHIWDNPLPVPDRVYEEDMIPNRGTVLYSGENRRINLAIAGSYRITDEYPIFYIGFPKDNVFDSVETENLAISKMKYKGWDKTSVQKILSNEIYIGNLLQGKTSITARNENNRTKNKQEDWVLKENTHEALISHETFECVLEIRKKKKQKADAYMHRAQDCPLDENIFDEVLFCGVCGRKMTRDSLIDCHKNGEKIRRYAYFCLNGMQNKVDVCPEKNRIIQTQLSDILLSLFRMEFATFLHKRKKYLESGEKIILESVKNVKMKLKETERKIRKVNEEESAKYVDYRTGKIAQSEYVTYKMKQEERLKELIEKIEIQKKEIQKLGKSSKDYKKAITELLKLKSAKELTKDMIEAFVSKIYVYPGKRIEVVFKFSSWELY